MRRLFVILMLVFAFGTISSSAKGLPDYYVIEGEGMFPMILHLDTGLIFDPESRIQPAPELDTEPYILSSYGRTDEDLLVEALLSPLHYYPEEGIIYFVGAMDQGVFQPYDHKWYVVYPDIAETLNTYITAGRDIYTMPDKHCQTKQSPLCINPLWRGTFIPQFYTPPSSSLSP